MGKQLNIYGNVEEGNLLRDNIDKIISILEKYKIDTVDKLENIFKGQEGERTVKKYLNSEIGNYGMQIDDFRINREGRYQLSEIKSQYKVNKGDYYSPIEGHGLHPAQVEARVRLSEKYGWTPMLYINCLTDKVIYYGDLRELLKTETHTFSKGDFRKERILFNIKYFNKSVLGSEYYK